MIRINLLSLSILSILIITLSTSHARENENIEQLGRIYYSCGAVYDVVVDGNLAYLAAGVSGLQIINVADSQNITVTGRWEENPGHVVKIAQFGNYAYILDTIAGLYVVDIHNPNLPQMAGSYEIPSGSNDLTIVENQLYIANEDSGIVILDVSNPEQIEEITTYDTPGTVQSVSIVDNYAHIADGNGGYRILDISDINDINEIGHIELQGEANAIEIVGDLAYVAAGGSGMSIINIADPQQPVEIGNCETRGSTIGISVEGDIACLAAGGWGGLRIVDIADPQQPQEIGSYRSEYGGAANQVMVQNNIAYLAYTSSRLHLIDINNPREPNVTGRFTSYRTACAVFTVNDNAFLALRTSRNSELRIINAGDPDHPGEIGCYIPEEELYFSDVSVTDSYAYIAASDGMSIIDISNPNSPVDSCFFEQLLEKIVILGDYAYGKSGNEMSIIDISNPARPSIVGTYQTQGQINNLSFLDDYVYLAKNSELEIINISNPQEPNRVSSFESPSRLGFYFSVSTVGGYAYLGTGVGIDQGVSFGAQFHVININDPEHAVEVGHCQLTGIANSISIIDDFAYIACSSSYQNQFDDCYQGGLYVVDVVDPEEPAIVGYYNTPGNPMDVFVTGGLAYLADDTNLGIYRFTSPRGIAEGRSDILPGKFCLFPAYPNPFNSSTTIRYSLSASSAISLQVFDLTDRYITCLARGQQQPGLHSMTWDASDLPSGIYFLRLQSGRQQFTREVMLIR